MSDDNTGQQPATGEASTPSGDDVQPASPSQETEDSSSGSKDEAGHSATEDKVSDNAGGSGSTDSKTEPANQPNGQPESKGQPSTGGSSSSAEQGSAPRAETVRPSSSATEPSEPEKQTEHQPSPIGQRKHRGPTPLKRHLSRADERREARSAQAN